jgi:hypothetical protein
MQTQHAPQTRRSLRLVAAIACALALQVPLAGCFGKFALVRKVYGFNETVGDKWLRSLLTFALVIIPVYSIAALVDYVILNVIEFWTGSNPAVANLGPGETLEKTTVASDGTRLQIIASDRGETLTLTVTRPGAAPETTVLRKTAGGAEARSASGALLSSLTVTEEGGAVVTDASGAVVVQRSAAEVSQLAASAKLGGEAVAQALEVQRSLRVASAR